MSVSKKAMIVGLALTGGLCGARVVRAQIVNGDFEAVPDGLAHWTWFGEVEVTQSLLDPALLPDGFGDPVTPGTIDLADLYEIQSCFNSDPNDPNRVLAAGSPCHTIDYDLSETTEFIEMQYFFLLLNGDQHANRNRVALLQESTRGGLSRIRQTFSVSGSPKALSFKYQLSGGPTGGKDTPPDAFAAFLIDPNTGDPLVGNGLALPIFRTNPHRRHDWRCSRSTGTPSA